MRILLLADLYEQVHADAGSDLALFSFELADALREYSRDLGGFSVDMVARRGSSRVLPLITADIDEIPASRDAYLDSFARQESTYCQLVLSGLLHEYNLIHCVAPIVTPLQLISAAGIPIIHTLLMPDAHPSAHIPRVLIRVIRLIAVTSEVSGQSGAPLIRQSVDLRRFRPSRSKKDKAGYILCLQAADPRAAEIAKTVAANLDCPLRTDANDDPVQLLNGARLFLDLSRSPSRMAPPWALRALACGTPVVGWTGGGLDSLVDEPAMGGLVERDNIEALVETITNLDVSPTAVMLRRQLMLAHHSRRATAARYVELYRSMLEAS